MDSTLVIIGAVLVLAPIFVFLTVDSINRQKENTHCASKRKGRGPHTLL